MSATTRARCRAADDGLRVVDHLGHRDAHRRLVAEHDLAERVADEEHRDARFVEDPGGRVVVRGEHRDALAVGVHPRDVPRSSAGGPPRSRPRRPWRSSPPSRLHVRHRASLPGRVALVQRRGHAVAEAVRDLALGHERGGPRVCRRSGRGSTTRFVSAPKPDPASATSFATRKSTPFLFQSLSAARAMDPVSAAKPTSTGRREAAARGSRVAVRRRGPGPGGRPRARGRAWGRSSSVSAPRPGGASSSAGLGRREVGHRGGHHGASQPGGSSRARASSPGGAPPRARPVVSTRTTCAPSGGSDLHRGGDEGHRAPRVERRPGDRDAHLPGRAVADVAHRIDRLASPARGDDDAPAHEIRVARGGDEGGRAAGWPPGSRDRRRPRRRHPR